MWQEIEQAFNRALSFALTRKKFFLIFPTLLICGIAIVFCHMLWVEANPWVRASLAFVPGFLLVAFFLAVAVPLIRLYHDEVKHKSISVNQTLNRSWSLMGSVSSIILPIVTVYLALWFVLGLFYLIKNLPVMGEALAGILSFGPFLLIAGSLVLCLISFALLFFLTPVVALKSTMSWDLAEEVLKQIGKEPFLHIILLLIGVFPMIIVVALLTLAAALTGMTYFITERTWAIALQWFVIMIPFGALISPAVLFFFNFAGESFVILQRHKKS